MSTSYYMRKISQVDNTTLAIEWNDGIISQYKLSDLQRNCPCAGCIDESTGQRRLPHQNIPEQQQVKKIINVGNYAIRLFFNSGCTHGIYTYDHLRSLDFKI